MPTMRGYPVVLLFAVFIFGNITRAQAPYQTKITIKPDLSPSKLSSLAADDNTEPGIGLAMSGGGARGLAHIGVLKVLKRENIKVNYISAVSMGGVIGGLFSCGYSPEEIERIALDIKWGELLSPGPLRSTLLTTQKGQSEKSLFKIRFEGWKPVVPRAITSGQNLSLLLENLTARGGVRSSISFDYLDPPLRIICTDLTTGEKVIVSSGSLGEAMRATMAVPVAFTPVDINGRILVDGGLVDPIPVDVTREAIGFPVVAVNTSSGLLPVNRIENVVDIADQTTTIMSMVKKRESESMADLTIAPDLKGRTSSDFSDVPGLIRAGEEAAEKALPAIRKLLADRGQLADTSPKYPIANWRITGLASMPMTFFASGFDKSGEMSASMIEANLKRAYASGYLSDAWAELVPETSSYLIDYHLKDNARIRSIRFGGSTMFADSLLYGLITSRPGMVLNTRTADRDRRNLENYYINSGYTLARVSAAFDDSSGELAFNIDEGRINRILLEGNDRTRNWVIKRHIPFRSGDVFKQRQAERAVEDIYSTDLFESTKLIAIPDSAGISLVVKVTERPFNFLRAGASFDNEYGSRAFFDLVDDNIFGTGQEIYLSTKVGEKKRSVSLNFQADRIFETLFTYTLSFDYREFKRNYYVDHDYRGYFRQFSTGGELSLGRQFPRLGAIAIVGQLRRFSWDEPDKVGRQKFAKVSVGVRSIVDTRDAISFPESGKYHVVDLEFAGNLYNEKATYTRLFTSLEAYYALSRRLNFHPRVALGASSDFMPFFDEFSLGGIHNFPGLHEDEFLGDKLLLGSLEVRYRVLDRVYLIGSYNAGNIWDQLERVRLSRLRYSGGIGLGLRTPIGPIETWYGRTSRGLDAFYLRAGYEW